MKKVEKLISIARQKAACKARQTEAAKYSRMTIEQLKELAFGDPSEDRIKEIFDSVERG